MASRRDLPIRSQLVGPVLAYVRAKGGDAAALIRAFDLPLEAETEPEVILQLARLQAFFEAAEEASRDRCLGLHLALALPAGRWTALEYGARSASTVREAMRVFARYVAIFNEHVRITFEERRGEGVVSQRVPGRPLSIGRHGNEFFAASVLCHVRAGLAGPAALIPSRVFFAHPPPRPAALREITEYFGVKAIEFGTERNGFAIRAEDLDRPMTTRNPALLALVDAYVDGQIEERGVQPGGGFLAQVRSLVREALAQRTPSLTDSRHRRHRPHRRPVHR